MGMEGWKVGLRGRGAEGERRLCWMGRVGRGAAGWVLTEGGTMEGWEEGGEMVGGVEEEEEPVLPGERERGRGVCEASVLSSSGISCISVSCSSRALLGGAMVGFSSAFFGWGAGAGLSEPEETAGAEPEEMGGREASPERVAGARERGERSEGGGRCMPGVESEEEEEEEETEGGLMEMPGRFREEGWMGGREGEREGGLRRGCVEMVPPLESMGETEEGKKGD